MNDTTEKGMFSPPPVLPAPDAGTLAPRLRAAQVQVSGKILVISE